MNCERDLLVRKEVFCFVLLISLVLLGGKGMNTSLFLLLQFHVTTTYVLELLKKFFL